MKPNFILLALLLFTVLLAACTQASRDSNIPSPVSVEPIVWPQPPSPARIRFVSSVSRPTDLGIKPKLSEQLKRFIGGAKQPRFVRPSGVSAAQGVIYVADPGAQSLWILNPEAGSYKQIRSVAGKNLASPVAVAVADNGRLYLSDSYLAKVFVFNSDGELLETIGEGSLQRPAGIAFDSATQRLYVADSAAHCIRVFSGASQLIKSIGQRGAGEGEFNFPTYLTVDRQGTLYVTDSLGFRVQMFDRDGQFQGAFGHHGNASGDFAAPKGIAVDSEAHIYIVDALFDTVQVFDKTGRLLLNIGERGTDNGQFWLPAGIFIDQSNRLYVADTYNQRIQLFDYLGENE